MDLSSDRFPIVCKLANKDGFVYPGADKFGACTAFTNNAVKAKERTGCAFKKLRKPEVEKKKGKLTNPLKASKRKVKTGAVAIDDADDK